MTERGAQKRAEDTVRAMGKVCENCRYLRSFLNERLYRGGVADMQMVLSACNPDHIKHYLKWVPRAASDLTTFTTKLRKLEKLARKKGRNGE